MKIEPVTHSAFGPLAEAVGASACTAAAAQMESRVIGFQETDEDDGLYCKGRGQILVLLLLVFWVEIG